MYALRSSGTKDFAQKKTSALVETTACALTCFRRARFLRSRALLTRLGGGGSPDLGPANGRPLKVGLSGRKQFGRGR